jgi:cell division septum initiation protein DivIVA
MKKLKKDLEAILKALKGLTQKVEKLQEQIVEKTKPTKKPKTKPVKAKAVKKTALKKVAAKKVAVKKRAAY